jgi:hypothetical protein
VTGSPAGDDATAGVTAIPVADRPGLAVGSIVPGSGTAALVETLLTAPESVNWTDPVAVTTAGVAVVAIVEST